MFDDAGDPYDGIYLYVHQGTTLGFERWGNGSSASRRPAWPPRWSYVVGTFDGTYGADPVADPGALGTPRGGDPAALAPATRGARHGASK